MECTFAYQCGSSECKQDRETNLTFASVSCQKKYYRIRMDVEEASSFDPVLFRSLWLLHVALTRQVILSLVYQPGKRDEIDRRVKALLANQSDLGKEIGLAVGDKGFGEASTHLLEAHIVGAKVLLEALIASKSDREIDLLFAKWAQNGKEISGALGGKLFADNADARADLEEEMVRHLDLTFEEMKYTVARDTKKSRAYYSAVMKCILQLSELLSSAIVAREEPKVMMMHSHNGRKQMK